MKVLSFGQAPVLPSRDIRATRPAVPPSSQDSLEIRFGGRSGSPDRLLARLLKEADQAVNWDQRAVTVSGGSTRVGRELSLELDGKLYTLRQVQTHQVAQREGLAPETSLTVKDAAKPDAPGRVYPLMESAFEEAFRKLLETGRLRMKEQIRDQWLRDADQAENWQLFEMPDSEWMSARIGEENYRLSSNIYSGERDYMLYRHTDEASASFVPHLPLSRKEYQQLKQQLLAAAEPQLRETYGLGENLDASALLSDLLREKLAGLLTVEFKRVDNRTPAEDWLEINRDGTRITLSREARSGKRPSLYINRYDEMPALKLQLKGERELQAARLLFELIGVEQSEQSILALDGTLAGQEAEALARLEALRTQRRTLQEARAALPPVQERIAGQIRMFLEGDAKP